MVNLKTVRINTYGYEKPIVYENVIDIYIYPDGTDYAGYTIYASLCQKAPPNMPSNGGKYYTYIYKRIEKVEIESLKNLIKILIV